MACDELPEPGHSGISRRRRNHRFSGRPPFARASMDAPNWQRMALPAWSGTEKTRAALRAGSLVFWVGLCRPMVVPALLEAALRDYVPGPIRQYAARVPAS